MTLPMKAPKKPKPPKHIPALSPAQLAVALDKLKKARNINPAAKQQLELMMRAASNPKNENAEVVVKTLPMHRQQRIQSMTAAMTQQVNGIIQRAGKGLDAISDEEFNQLVEDANAAS